jgi:tetratricopeptide (TPR) repeat protein
MSNAALLAIASILGWGQHIGLNESYPKNPADAYTTIRRLRSAEKQGRLPPAERKSLGLAYYAAGQHLLFRRAMLDAIAADPGDPDPHFFLGRHYGSDVQDFGLAASYFRAAVERKASPDAMAYLGHALEMQGERERALSLYRRVSDPCHAVAAAGLARLGAASIDDLSRCKTPHPVLARELAKMLSAQGRHAEAARRLEEALAREPTSASLVYQLYRAYRAAGDAANAANALALYRSLAAIYGGQ